MATDWSLDYCLGCDRQTAGEAYCSQACRLADLENSSNGSEPTSPTSNRSFSWAPSSQIHPTSGFFLPPAFDFSAHRSHPSSLSSSNRPGSAGTSPSVSSSLSHSAPSPRILTPSSSRSSLSSAHTISAQGEFISSQARSELRDYTNSFDTVRDFRRRMTTS